MNKTRIRQEYVEEGYTEPGLKIVNIWEMIGFDSQGSVVLGFGFF